MAPCAVAIYDCFRGWCNPKSIQKKPWKKAQLDVHEAYYTMFLMPSEKGVTPAMLLALKGELTSFIDSINCAPILVRLAWHDSGTFDTRIQSWPECGGANGAIILAPELNMGANAGLDKAVRYLKTFKQKYPAVSWADLIQMASATAIEWCGGPNISMKYGRVSVTEESQCAGPQSRQGFGGNAGLPDAKPPFGCGAESPAEHLRNVFTKKMGFNDQEIVALSGAHTIGRAFKERSGTCPFGYTSPSNYTDGTRAARVDGKIGAGMQGGCSWTKTWLKFDNSYFTDYAARDAHLLWFPTDEAVQTDPFFKPTFDLYASDQAAFFKDYAAAHKKLSELGAKFEPAQGITL